MTREQQIEALLRSLVDAAYSVACESNGIWDNEWTPKNGITMVPEFPVRSFREALTELNETREKGWAFLNPEEAEKQERWINACATAASILDIAKTKGLPDRFCGSLSRNIADAIVGNIKITADERESGKRPVTMEDRLAQLVEEGKLHRVEPKE